MQLACSFVPVRRFAEHAASNWLLRCWIFLQVEPGDPDVRHRSHQCSLPEGTRGQTAGRCTALTAQTQGPT